MQFLALTHAVAIAISFALDHAGHPDALPVMWGYLGAVAFLHVITDTSRRLGLRRTVSQVLARSEGRAAHPHAGCAETDGPKGLGSPCGPKEPPSSRLWVLVGTGVFVLVVEALLFVLDELTLTAIFLGMFSYCLAHLLEYGRELGGDDA